MFNFFILNKNSFKWIKDEDVTICHAKKCGKPFKINRRRHHCRLCGKIFCRKCSTWRIPQKLFTPNGFISGQFIDINILESGNGVRSCEVCYNTIKSGIKMMSEKRKKGYK